MAFCYLVAHNLVLLACSNHIYLTPKELGCIVHPHCFHHLIWRLLAISHFWLKNKSHLKLRHIVAMSHSETGKGDYIKTTHSKIESSSPVCIQIGLFTLVELDYVETKTASLIVSQKFWHRPNLHLGMHASCKQSLQ
jgi:hypothetical protein